MKSTSSARPTRNSADATRAQILTAALDLFSQTSFEGASTRQIANAAGVPQPLLAYHFENKELLWQAAVTSLFQEFARYMEDAHNERGVTDEVEELKCAIRDFVRFSAEHPQMHRLIMQACKTKGSRLEWMVETHIRPLFNFALATLRPLVQRGLVRNLPEANLYYLFTGVAATIFVLAPECELLTGIDPCMSDQVEIQAQLVIDTIFIERQA
jgi:AcrR family transcriptional regulator